MTVDNQHPNASSCGISDVTATGWYHVTDEGNIWNSLNCYFSVSVLLLLFPLPPSLPSLPPFLVSLRAGGVADLEWRGSRQKTGSGTRTGVTV